MSTAVATPAARPVAQRAPDALEKLRIALDEARAHEKADPSKANALATDVALDAYNTAVTARVATLESEMRRLDRIIKRLTPRGRETDGGRANTPLDIPRELLYEYEDLRTEYVALRPHTVQLPPDVTQETEPNNTTAQATPLDVMTQPCVIASGLITPAGDVDFYSVTVPAGARLWAYVDTGASTGTSSDSVLTVYGSDGTTVLESDDDDGTGNNCDASVESLEASAVAGLPLSAGGTYFLQVRASSGTDTLGPYAMFVVTSTGAVAPETEPNDSTATATPILTQTTPIGERSGSISPGGDVDTYSLFGSAGTPLFITVDADPERDGGTDVAVDFISSGGTLLFTADSSGSATASAEAFCFIAPTSGTFYVRVHGATGATTGTYSLLVASCVASCDALPCPPASITGTLGSGSPDYPSVSGTQIGRLNRFDPPSLCEAPKFCPGLFATTGIRAYDAYTFRNCGITSTCVTVSVQTACTGTNFIFPVAYSGSFDPNDLCSNYLADTARSPDPTASMSFTVEAGQTFVLVFHEVTPGAGCPSYTFSIDGLPCVTSGPCSIVCPMDVTADATTTTGGTTVTYPAPTTTGTCGPVTCTPASGSVFPLGTTLVTCTEPSGAACSFNVTVQVPFGVCVVDDATGDTFSAVVTGGPTSPMYGYWEYHVAATGQVLCGHAESVAYRPGASAILSDRNPADNTVGCTSFFLDARISYSSSTSTVRVTDRTTGRVYILRDRNVNDSVCR